MAVATLGQMVVLSILHVILIIFVIFYLSSHKSIFSFPPVCCALDSKSNCIFILGKILISPSDEKCDRTERFFIKMLAQGFL